MAQRADSTKTDAARQLLAGVAGGGAPTRSYLLAETAGAGRQVTPVSSMTMVRGPSAPSLRNGPVGLVVVVGAVGVEELDGAGAVWNLEAVVEVGTGSEGLSAEAGAGGTIDLEEFDGLGGVIADGGDDVWGVAAGPRR